MQRLETLPRPQCSASSPAMQRKPSCEDLGEKNTARKKENSCFFLILLQINLKLEIVY
jgi:hypothetical protein